MNVSELIDKICELYFFSIEDCFKAEITDIRVNENGKWIEFELSGIKEVIKID